MGADYVVTEEGLQSLEMETIFKVRGQALYEEANAKGKTWGLLHKAGLQSQLDNCKKVKPGTIILTCLFLFFDLSMSQNLTGSGFYSLL